MSLNDSQAKNLYKWKKHDSKLNSKIKESDNIQNIHQWLRKVENASETAINKAFNTKVPSGCSPLEKNDDPFSEAHSLINQWVADKIRLDIDDDIFNYVNVDEMNTFDTNQKVLDQIKLELLNDETDNVLDIKGVDYDKYDEEYIASDLINKMMKKKFVDPAGLLKSDERKAKPIDYQLKIEMRHQAVKENREKRMREIEQKRKERLEKKEIELKAKQIVQKEEQDKQARMKIEQQLIDQEVQRLRIQMAEQRKHEEEIRKRHQEMEMIRTERERQEMLNLKKKFDLSNMESEIEAKRNLMAEKRAEDLVNTYLRAKNLRTVQKIFSSWYGLILENRLKIGKANALADWKLSYKVFNAWKKLSTSEKTKKDQEIHQNLVKIENIKNVKATNHYNTNLMRKLFEEWKKFTRNEILLKEAESEKLKTKIKMQKFLEAAAEGKIQPQVDNLPLTSRSNRSNHTVRPNTLRRSKSFENDKSTKKVSKQKPNSHQNKISYIETDDDENEKELDKSRQNKREVNLEKKVKELMWPWMKSSPQFVNNLDNRFKAQEKLLHEQHQMIKEQQKVIEEMKFKQNQVAFKEQIALLEQIKAKQLELEKMQKQQYQQEKKLLRQKANAKTKPLTKEAETSKVETEIEVETEREQEKEISLLNDQSMTNLTNRTVTTGRKQDQFTKNMEERAKQREQMRKEREEKKRIQELEKLKMLQAQQEEKLRLEEEERRKKQEELKEKLKKQKELDDKRNTEKQREQANNLKADLFYKKYLMRYYCLTGFKKLIELRDYKMNKATEHYNHKLFGKIIYQWKLSVFIDLNRRYEKADDFNNKRIVKNCFKFGLKQFKQCIQIETAKANRFYRYKIKAKLFEAWKLYKDNENEKAISYEILIAEHNLNRIRVKYFKIWKDFPNENRRLKEKQKRLDELRSKVRQMIPDFEAPSVTSSNS